MYPIINKKDIDTLLQENHCNFTKIFIKNYVIYLLIIL